MSLCVQGLERGDGWYERFRNWRERDRGLCLVVISWRSSQRVAITGSSRLGTAVTRRTDAIAAYSANAVEGKYQRSSSLRIPVCVKTGANSPADSTAELRARVLGSLPNVVRLISLRSRGRRDWHHVCVFLHLSGWSGWSLGQDEVQGHWFPPVAIQDSKPMIDKHASTIDASVHNQEEKVVRFVTG